MHTAHTADALYAAEAPALAAGAPLMARAARGIADVVASQVSPPAAIGVLAGGGNNGADALYAAAHLAREGFEVRALTTSLTAGADEAALAAADRAGVQMTDDVHRVAGARVWLDGLTGIGMRPPVRGELAGLLAELRTQRARRAEAPLVVAVDLPSGLGADTGAVQGPALPADHTVTFGGYKAAQFLPPAAHLCGRLHLIDIGIAEELARQEVAVHRMRPEDRWWPLPAADDHKYTRGVLGMVTGSEEYPGAAVLGAHGALRMGPGMVRYLGQVPGPVLARHPEVVTAPGRVQAWVVGSGITGRGSSAAPGVERALEDAMAREVPVVVDAGGLDWVEPGTLAGRATTGRVVLTPHAGELAGLLTRCGYRATREEVEADPARWALEAARVTGATVVLKGGITLIAGGGLLFSQGDGTGWMASAGTGDVLAGVLGGVLAGHQARTERGQRSWPSIAHAVAAGVMIHGRAGRHASGGGPLTASDLAGALQPVLRGLLAD